MLPILPVLLAEATLWLGFGALLPVLPLYLAERGIDAATLGWIVAAWPAARLIGEPVMGWLADRRDKRMLMLAGLVLGAVVVPLPLLVTGAPAFLLARALTGLAAAAYDPAARGYLMDATPPHQHGAAFGLYSSAQMVGALIGPAIGGLGVALGGGFAFPFIFCSATLAAAALLLALTTLRRPVPRHAPDQAGTPARAPAGGSDARPPAGARSPVSLWNRLLLAAIVINIGAFIGDGIYGVVWSLWMAELGADIGLIGLTFTAFGVGFVLVAPFAGHWADRFGPLWLIVLGSLGASASGILYAFIVDPVLAVPVAVFEGFWWALLGPALFATVARATPAGRSSMTQGVFGAAGTLGSIVASIAAGFMFGVDMRLPFYLYAGTMAVALGLGLLVGGHRLRGLRTAAAGADAGDQAIPWRPGREGIGLLATPHADHDEPEGAPADPEDPAPSVNA